MWPSSLVIGLRSLTRSKVYTLINVFGLAMGMAACLAIAIFIRFETSFDSWLVDADRTFQIQQINVGGENAGRRGQVVPYVTSTVLARQLPEIEVAASLVRSDAPLRIAGRPVALDHGYEVDGDVFEVLKLPLARGDPATALSQAGNIVLTEATARRLFGRTDVVGRTLTRITENGDFDGRVTAVLRDIPDNSHLRIDMLYRVDPGGPGSSLPAAAADGWWWGSGWVYARLRPGADVAAMNARIPAMLRRLVPHDPREGGPPFRFELVPVRDINNLSTFWGRMTPGTSWSVIVTFAIIALLLLFVACVNFTNLSTARATRRAREVGLRKVLGASRGQLVVQFVGESLLMASVAGLLALALLELTMPALAALLDSELRIDYFGAQGIALPAFVFVLLVGFVGGLYPAFYLSRFRPAEVLKANQSSVEPPGAGRLRNALVVGQFAAAIALIICTTVIYRQTEHARTADPGYRPSGLLIAMEPERIGDPLQVESFLREARAIPGVTAAARTGVFPDARNNSFGVFHRDGATEGPRLQLGLVDGDTFATLGLRLIAGRLVSTAREADLSPPGFLADEEVDPAVRARGINVVLGESAVRLFGFADAEAALGATLDLESEESQTRYTVVGVVNDARFGSMRTEPLPILYMAAREGHSAIALRYEPGQGGQVRDALARLWERRVDDGVFEASFGEDRIAEMYAGDARRGFVFALFAGLAILISCLGLFGLSAFMVERRTREIGIRKVLGARTRDIVRLLVWQFSKPVVVANLIAWPLAWWAMRDWLNGFADRIDLGPAPFLLAGLLALVIAMATVLGHALRVARANPIYALRYE